jgi:hypothetical protein
MAITWTATGTRSAKAVCTTGTESAPADGLTPADGLGAILSDAKGYYVCIEADSAQTLSGAGTLHAYLWNPLSGVWARFPDGDFTVSVSAKRGMGFLGNEVVSGRGRVAYVPNGVTVSAGGLTIYINVAFDKDGRAV